jgi:hypothetical protein
VFRVGVERCSTDSTVGIRVSSSVGRILVWLATRVASSSLISCTWVSRTAILLSMSLGGRVVWAVATVRLVTLDGWPSLLGILLGVEFFNIVVQRGVKVDSKPTGEYRVVVNTKRREYRVAVNTEGKRILSHS